MDEIHTSTLKLIIEEIVPSLTHIVNLSLEAATFPDKWKVSKIIPLHKRDDPKLPKNYRPVALLSVLSKVLERVVYKQVVAYLDKHELIHPSHHGARAGHSTGTAVIEMYDDWLTGIDNGEMAAAMMIDLSAAFDLVNHELLLKKLKLLGFDEKSIAWFANYLKGRSQRVTIDGQMSEAHAVNIGAPQGSILAVLLYIIFGNDIPEVVHNKDHACAIDDTISREAKFTRYCNECGNACVFVDDSTYTCTGSCPTAMSKQLSEQYKNLAEYMNNNRLVINPEKTHLVVMGTRKHNDLRNRVQVDTGSGIITPSENEKLLGINVHQSMKWGNHVISNKNSLINCLSTRLTGLKYISKVASFKTRLKIANACFMSILIYMIAIWGGTEDYILNSVQVMQNKAAKCITKTVDLYTPTRVLLRQCGWMSVRQLVFYHTVLQMWKTMKTHKPVHIYSQLKLSNTRSANTGTLKIPFMNTGLANKSFIVRGPLCWNEIPAEIRDCNSLPTFKKKLKKYVIQHIPIT